MQPATPSLPVLNLILHGNMARQYQCLMQKRKYFQLLLCTAFGINIQNPKTICNSSIIRNNNKKSK